jgi:lipid II isoglutaminyl synthase (glutamine-hydrolysing)
VNRPLTIAHLYPELLNLYADKGNIRTLTKRLEWRNIEVEVISVHLQDTLDLAAYDIVLLGGGSDREQALIGETLRPLQAEWRAAVEDGLPVLAVCGGYQLLGEYYELPDGIKVPGLQLLNMQTAAGITRLIGNVAIDSEICGSIVGFENHAGRTIHTHEPLGQVVFGHGNNGEDGKEGVHFHNVIGTYIHGPLLPKNPQLADVILQTALTRRGFTGDWETLDDTLENNAHQAFINRRIEGAKTRA